MDNHQLASFVYISSLSIYQSIYLSGYYYQCLLSISMYLSIKLSISSYLSICLPIMAYSAGAAEYTDCLSAEVSGSLNECPDCDTKQSDG